MPRLSLWREDKGNDYHFIDGVIKEQFLVGGTGILIHKYLGPQETGPSDDPSQPNNQASGTTNETSIQDVLFLENRDRKYDPDIYELRGHYNVNDNDFDLTQFGLFLSNDTIYLTFHINDMVEIPKPEGLVYHTKKIIKNILKKSNTLKFYRKKYHLHHEISEFDEVTDNKISDEINRWDQLVGSK